MSVTRFRAVAAGVTTLALVAGGMGATAMLAAPATPAGIQASAKVRTSPYAFWLAQVNHTGVCRMISGCVGSSGSEWRWNLRLQFDTPAGVQEVPATVRVVKQIPFRFLKLQVAADTMLGDVHTVARLTLRGSSETSTSVTLRLGRIRATGLAAAYTDDFVAALQPYLTARARAINGELAATGARVALRLRKARRVTATARVTTDRLSPTAPAVTGRVVVYIDGAAVCGAKLRSTHARCRFPAPKTRTDVFAVVNGTLPSGSPVSATGKARYRP